MGGGSYMSTKPLIGAALLHKNSLKYRDLKILRLRDFWYLDLDLQKLP